LQEIEENTNNTDIRGCYIQLEKVLPQAGEDPKAAKGGKKAAAGTDEVKPICGQAWFDLTPFMYAGQTESLQRCFVKTLKPKQEVEEG